MYLSRLTPIRRDTFSQPLADRPWDPYGLHQEVWKLFADDPERKRDFLYRLDGDGGQVIVYTLSARPPEAAGRFFQVATKELRPSLRAGDRLRFLLRVNPVVSRKAGSDPEARGKRHDLVMDERFRRHQAGTPKSELPARESLAQSVAKDWLAARSERLGFAVDARDFGVLRYAIERFPKANGRGPKISIGVCDFEGALTVRDPEVFLATLRQGIGPAKGFGCGLLLIRRAGEPA